MIWGALLPFLALAIPALAVIGVLVQAARVVRRRRLLASTRRARWLEGGLLAAAVACIVYGVGNWQGHLLDLRSASEICGAEVGRGLQQSALPLRNRCILTDGRSFDLVPAWINPLIAVALAVALVCAVLAVRAWLLSRSPTPVVTNGRPA